MQDLMFADEPVEKREQLLRDNCDQIVERSYTRKFEQHEVNARREELENVSIQVAELEDKLAEIRADYKGRIKPLLERRGLILDELKARGEYVKGDCFKFVDVDEGRLHFIRQRVTSWRKDRLPPKKDSVPLCNSCVEQEQKIKLFTK